MRTFILLPEYREYPLEEMKQRAASFYAEMKRRRTVRRFSDRPVPREVIEDCLKVAGTAPNGANLQPWHFVMVSDPVAKKKIREAAEEEEREFYNPSPMGFLNEILGRPSNERPFLLLVVGYPAEGAEVPMISKKPLKEIATFA